MWSNYSKDNFFAPSLSSLVNPEAPLLVTGSDESETWVASFVWNSIMRFRIAEPTRSLIYSLLRRADGAVRSYQRGRSLLDGIKGATPTPSITKYSHCLYAFEECVAMTYQGLCLLRQLHPEKEKLFLKDDGSEIQRLDRLYNASKHADEWIANGKRLPVNGTLPVWITNDGLACIVAILSFAELAVEVDELCEMARAFAILNVPDEPAAPVADAV